MEPRMQTVSEIMSYDVAVLSPQDDVKSAAHRMKDWDVGALPVCDGERLVGMLTDRDIVTRALAEERPIDRLTVAELMTADVSWCYEDQTVDAVLQQMSSKHVRRMPVVNHDMQLVGIVSLDDFARLHAASVDETLGEIAGSSPVAHPTGEVARLLRPPSDQADGKF